MDKRISSMSAKATCVALLLGACFLFYWGTATLFMIPGNIGESYIKSIVTWRLLPGIVPFFASPVLVVVAAWLWGRSNGSSDPWAYVGKTFQIAASGLVLFFVGLLIVASALRK
jgi:hypothetical protein